MLLLLTNDGEFAHRIMHPRFKIAKSYFVKVRGLIQVAEMEPLRRGPVIDGRAHMPVQSKILHQRNDKTWLEVILHEGTNQQIKKMFPDWAIRCSKLSAFGLAVLIWGPYDLENIGFSPRKSASNCLILLVILVSESPNSPLLYLDCKLTWQKRRNFIN